MSEKPQPMTDAERRLAMLISDVPGTSLVQPEAGMPAMTPMKPKPGIPYETAVSNGPTPVERFVGSLGEFKTKALDMMPVVGTARDLARAGHEGAQGNPGMAFLHAFNAMNPMSMVMPTQAGAKINPLQALANFKGGAQMPEHAARMAAAIQNMPRDTPAIVRGNIDAGIMPKLRNYGQTKGYQAFQDNNPVAAASSPQTKEDIYAELWRMRGRNHGDMIANEPVGRVDPYEAALALQRAKRMDPQ